MVLFMIRFDNRLIEIIIIRNYDYFIELLDELYIIMKSYMIKNKFIMVKYDLHINHTITKYIHFG